MTKSELKEIIKTRQPTQWWKIFIKENSLAEEFAKYKILESEPISQTAYNILHDITTIPKCKCGNDLKMYNNEYRSYCSKKCTNNYTIKKRIATYKSRTGYSSPLLNPAVRNSMKEKSLNKYGTEHPLQSQEVIKKRKATKLKRYGNPTFVNPQKTKSTKLKLYGESGYYNKEKHHQTCLMRYGNAKFTNHELAKKTKLLRYNDCFYNNSEKRIQTCLEKYNAESNMLTPEFKQKSRETCLKKYGVPNFSQSTLSTNGYRWKSYVLPSGKIIKIQGYENFLLDELLKIYPESEIKTNRSDMPEFWYTLNDKKHRYFPDVFIPSTSTIFEVKSKWTIKCDVEMNKSKFQSVKNAGYNFVLKIY